MRITVLFAAACALHMALAKEYYVDATQGDDTWDGSADYVNRDESRLVGPCKTLARVMALATKPGDVVHAAGGTYDQGKMVSEETLDKTVVAVTNRCVIPQGVSLVGSTGPERTVIVGTYPTAWKNNAANMRGVFMGKSSRMANVTVTRSAAPYPTTPIATKAYGGGVCMSDDCLLKDCVITNNAAERGGGVLAGARCVLLRCRLDNNTCAGVAGMVLGTSYEAVNCHLRNTSSYGTYYGSTSAKYVNCTFAGKDPLRNLGGGAAYNCYFDVTSWNAQDCTKLYNCRFSTQAVYDAVAAGYKDADTTVGTDLVNQGRDDYYTMPTGCEDESSLDLDGLPRVSGGRIDIGATEYDWRPDVADALFPGDMTVASASCDVRLDEQGGVVVPSGSELSFAVLHVPADEKIRFSIPVSLTGSAVVALYADGSDTPLCQQAADDSGVLQFSACAPNHWRIVVTGTGDATLGAMSVALLDLPDENIFHLAGFGRNASIVTADASCASTRLAADELAYYVKRMTGRELPVCGPGVAGRRVVIGPADKIPDLPAEGRAALAATDNSEASWTGTDGTTLWIAGKEAVAELYATYRFIESKLGVRWFKGATADDPGDHVETCASIAVPVFTEFRQPDFTIRRLDKACARGYIVAVPGETTAVRLGYQVPPAAKLSTASADYRAFYEARYPLSLLQIGGNHTTFVDAMPPETTFAEHPEYFALVNGERTAEHRHYCLSNPEVRSNVVENILKKFAANDGKGYFHFGIWDDGKGLCTCEACRALDPPEDPMYGRGSANVSTRFVKTVNVIAAKVWERYPAATLSSWAYQTYRCPPVGVAPDPRLPIQYCPHGRCYGHALDDLSCPANVTQCDWMREWGKLTPKLYTYEYYTCTPEHYGCRETIVGRDVRFYRKLGIVGVKSQGMFTGSSFLENPECRNPEDIFPSNWQHLYVLAHLLWDSDCDEAALLEDAERKYYGDAYPAMSNYHALRRRLWRNSAACMGYGTSNLRPKYMLDALGAEESLLGYLDEAERLAAGDAVRLARIARDRRYLNDYWIASHAPRNSDGSIRATRRPSRIAIDGVADEPAWQAGVAERMDGTPRTDYAVLFDDDALYFQFAATEPDGVATGDGMEIWFDPPSTGAVVRTRLLLGADGTSSRTGVTAAARSTVGGWTIEARVPCAAIFPVRDGDVWRILVRRIRNGVASPAVEPTDVASYKPMNVGSVLVQNASFRQTREDTANGRTIAAVWAFDGTKSCVVPFGDGHVVSLADRVRVNLGLGQSAEPREVEYTVRVRGTGRIQLNRHRYHDYTSDNGENMRDVLGSTNVATLDLTEESQTFRGTWTIEANQWNGFSFQPDGAGSVFVETVYVRNLSSVRKTLAGALAEEDDSRLETMFVDDVVPENGTERTILVEGYDEPACELPSGNSEATIAALHRKLALDVPSGLAARPLVREGGSLAVRYAAAPEYRVAADGTSPLCVLPDEGDAKTFCLDVANAVPGFWYTLLVAAEPTGPYDPCGTPVQATKSPCTLASSPTDADARFYKTRITPTCPKE